MLSFDVKINEYLKKVTMTLKVKSVKSLTLRYFNYKLRLYNKKKYSFYYKKAEIDLLSTYNCLRFEEICINLCSFSFRSDARQRLRLLWKL